MPPGRQSVQSRDGKIRSRNIGGRGKTSVSKKQNRQNTFSGGCSLVMPSANTFGRKPNPFDNKKHVAKQNLAPKKTLSRLLNGAWVLQSEAEPTSEVLD